MKGRKRRDSTNVTKPSTESDQAQKTIAQLKSGLAFHTVPTMTYAANSAWQHLVAQPA